MPLYYLAHRLFAAHDRALAARIADHLAQYVGSDTVFLPFCDTDEDALVADTKGQLLYDLDRQRLDRADGLLALLHGPSLDDGVCMEIGYAAARAVPIVVATTDFQTYGPTAHNSVSTFPDPLIDVVAQQIVRAHRLPAGNYHTAKNRLTAFAQQNHDLIDRLGPRATAALLDTASPAPLASPPTTPPRLYIEPSPYIHDPRWQESVRALQQHGWSTYTAARLQVTTDVPAAARTDWSEAQRCHAALVDVRGPETPPGAALIAGMYTALKRPVYTMNPPGWWTFAHGREPNTRNLMVHYAIQRIAGPAELATEMPSR
ncbi:nucleoside 2-deoxyribosyltransferase [Salinactinospora qingdaonensis]|uniref:Nucleoside 2-deoxyribosyltransferase n=1 Tax=Salinactinospora qingdaonensis TaxID=702744 RepID=A0ABP7GF41_9ACTN